MIFDHVNTVINLSDIYHWRFVIFTARPFSSYVIVIMDSLLYQPTMEKMNNFLLWKYIYLFFKHLLLDVLLIYR